MATESCSGEIDAELKRLLAPNDWANLLDEAWQEGHDRGYEAGQQDGSAECKVAFEDGQERGYALGKADAGRDD